MAKREKCKTCIHHSSGIYQGRVRCNYILDTGEPRGCDPEVCDKYERGIRDPRKEEIAFGSKVER